MKKLLVVLFLSLFFQESDAATLYTQIPAPGNQTGTLYQSSWFFPDGHDTDRYVYDTFTLPSAKTITELRWRGGYKGARGTIVGFTVNIYGSNASGQPIVTIPDTGPCTTCVAGYLVTGNAGETFFGTFGSVPMTSVYDYALVLPTPFQVVAGAKYWVQIEARQSAVPDWGLAQGSKAVSDGHMEYWKGVNTFYGLPGEAAFEILGMNTPPVAAPQSVTVYANVAKAITVSATDSDGDPLTYRVTTPPVHGTLSGAAPNLSYAPDANYVGPDSFTFTAHDGFADSNEATVNITVKVNTPAVATSQTVPLTENTTAVITLSALDIDGDPLTYRLVTQPLNGTLTGSAPNLIYSPSINFAGQDSFTFVANDGKIDSNEATVHVTVAEAVRLESVGYTAYFSDLKSAYGSALDGDVILAQAVPLLENLLRFDVIQAVKIKGGYDSVFRVHVINGMTTVRGTVVVGSGSVFLDRITIQ